MNRRSAMRTLAAGVGGVSLAGLAAMVGRDSPSGSVLIDPVHGELRPVVFQDSDPNWIVGDNGHLWQWINHPFRHNEKDVTWYDGHSGVAQSKDNLFLGQTSRFGSNNKPHHNVWVYGTKPDDNGQFELKGSFGNFHPIAPHGVNVQEEGGQEFAYLAFSNGALLLRLTLRVGKFGELVGLIKNLKIMARVRPSNQLM